jgi:hypothetical protein
LKKIALKVTLNIDSLIKDFFHVPPSYKSTVVLSWRTELKVTQPANSPLKRPHQNDGLAENSLKKKPERGVYHPPSGKYSHANVNKSENGSKSDGANGNGAGSKLYSIVFFQTI